MSTLVVYSNTTDGYVASDRTAGGTTNDYSTVRAGFGLTADTTGVSLWLGQYWAYDTDFDENALAVFEVFLGFDTSSIPDGDTVSAAVLNLTSQVDNSTTDFTIEARLYDWGATLTTADWVAGASLSGLTSLATKTTASGFTAGTAYDFTDVAFAANVNKTGTTRLLLCSSRTTAGTSPTIDVSEYVSAYSADQTGTTSDPKLTVTYSAGGGTLFLMLEDNSGSYELEDGSGGTLLEA